MQETKQNLLTAGFSMFLSREQQEVTTSCGDWALSDTGGTPGSQKCYLHPVMYQRQNGFALYRYCTLSQVSNTGYVYVDSFCTVKSQKHLFDLRVPLNDRR